MTEEEKILLEAARRIETGERFALATIVGASGSTPREVGSRMLIASDGSIIGSIGGAALERLTAEEALASLQTGKTTHAQYDLNDLESQQTGMICGGKVEVLIEPFGTSPRLRLFGAGHVGQAVARLVSEIGFNIVVYDSRPEWGSRERFPSARIVLDDMEKLAKNLTDTQNDFIALMTWSHDEDYKLLKILLPKPYFYLGVIGSKRKSVDIRRKLQEDGFAPEQIARLVCPIGLPLPTHTPAEIAISIAAQLLELKPQWMKRTNEPSTI